MESRSQNDDTTLTRRYDTSKPKHSNTIPFLFIFLATSYFQTSWQCSASNIDMHFRWHRKLQNCTAVLYFLKTYFSCDSSVVVLRPRSWRKLLVLESKHTRPTLRSHTGHSQWSRTWNGLRYFVVWANIPQASS